MNGRRLSPFTQVNLTGLLFLVFAGVGFGQSETVELIFLDVGQGDAVVVRSPEGKVALIDAGPGVDIVNLLRAHGIDSVDIAIASHPHADHIGGMLQVVTALPVRYYMDSGVPHTTSTYRNLMRALQTSDIAYLEANERTIGLGSVSMLVLPPPTWDDLNNTSVGIVVSYGEFKAILTGDSEIEELDYFLERGVPDVTVLKAPHHGSSDAVSPAWLDATKPEVVVISCGLNNPYEHPHPSALRSYEAISSPVYRTDLDGEVRVLARRDGEYEVVTGKRRSAAAEPRLNPIPATRSTPAGLSLWVFADAPGNDHYNLNGEYVVVMNNSAAAVEVGGWRLCDAAGACFDFPKGASIPAGERAVVFTGRGRSGGTTFYMNRGRAVWNNRGDVATLRDTTGRVVASYAY